MEQPEAPLATLRDVASATQVELVTLCVELYINGGLPPRVLNRMNSLFRRACDSMGSVACETHVPPLIMC